MGRHPRWSRALLAGAALALAAAGAAASSDTAARPVQNRKAGLVELKLLGINDLHGNLEPPSTVDGRPVGGVAFLAAWLDRAEAENRGGTIRVHAGDIVGGTPLVSSWFHDEPSIIATNRMGFDVGTLGNHEFDEGGREMLRLIRGGHREDGRQRKAGADTSDRKFPGARYPYVAANTRYARSGRRVLPPYAIVRRRGVRVGFIGVTTAETPSVVPASVASRFRFLDISDTVNRYVRVLRRKGVEAIVVLAHSGGQRVRGERARGEILDETRQMSAAVDVVVAGHTHTLLNDRIGGKLVVQALSYGTAFDDIDLTISRLTGEVVRSSASVPITFDDVVTPVARLTALVASHRRRVAPIGDRVVGQTAAPISRTQDDEGESALGDLIADAQRSAADADFAFVNSGSIRAGLPAGELTYADLFATQPFDTGVVRTQLTGDQIHRLLEQQFRPWGDNVLQVSGLRVAYDPAAQSGHRIAAVTLPDGTELDRGRSYSVAANSLLASGGDGFTTFRKRGKAVRVGGDVQVLQDHVARLPRPFGAPADVHTRRVRSG